jgi:hypothetical protein
MSFLDDVYRESLHDWIDEREPRPRRARMTDRFLDDPPEACDAAGYPVDPDEDRAAIDAAIDRYDAGLDS